MKYSCNIAVDLDGVVADFNKRYSQLAIQMFNKKGRHLPVVTSDEMVKTWFWPNFYPITEHEEEILWEEVYATKNFWTTLDVLDENGLKDLIKISKLPFFNTYFITSRRSTTGDTAVKQSIKWLAKNGMENPQVLGLHDKGPAINYLNIKYYIDDMDRNIIDAKKYSPDCEVYVRDFPHNRHLDDKKLGVTRVTNLSEFCKDVLKKEYSKIYNSA